MWIPAAAAAAAPLPTSNSGEGQDELKAAQEGRRAYALILAKIARRDHTEKEIATALTRKEFSREAIDLALARARQERLVDDTRFAGMLARQGANSGSKGPRKVLAKLRQKGIGGDLADRATRAAFADVPDRDEKLTALAERLYSRARGETDKERRIKALRSLIGRGFGLSESRRALDSATRGDE